MVTILTRQDLIRESEKLPIKDINIRHIRSSMKIINKSSLVLLCVDGNIRRLKDSYGLADAIYPLKELEYL